MQFSAYSENNWVYLVVVFFSLSLSLLKTCTFNEIGERMHCLNEQFTALSLFERFEYDVFFFQMEKMAVQVLQFSSFRI